MQLLPLLPLLPPKTSSRIEKWRDPVFDKLLFYASFGCSSKKKKSLTRKLRRINFQGRRSQSPTYLEQKYSSYVRATNLCFNKNQLGHKWLLWSSVGLQISKVQARSCSTRQFTFYKNYLFYYRNQLELWWWWLKWSWMESQIWTPHVRIAHFFW